MDKAKITVMGRILKKLRNKPLSVLVAYIDNYCKEFGEASREFFVATMWETVHDMNATTQA